MPIFFLICLFLLPSFAFSFEPPSLTNFQMKIWNNLLYRENGESKISDPDFFLGSKNLSSQKLFEIHLKLIDDERIICKFPARFTFISHIVKRQIDFKNCKDFINFSEKVEHSKIYINYASENVLSALSMMGHIYIELEGINNSKHSISFFANTHNTNVFKFIFETLISGKKGSFALAPAEHLRKKYRLEEQRNLWRYQLKLTSEMNDFLFKHFYELKNIELRYHFKTFNCATLIHHFLRIAYPLKSWSKKHWYGPIDILNEIQEHNIINQQNVFLANQWKAKAIYTQGFLSSQTLKFIKKNYLKKALDKSRSKIKNDLTREVAQDFNQDSFFKNKISKKQYLANQTFLNSMPNNHYLLDLNNFKNPLFNKQFSHLDLTSLINHKFNIFRLNILPLSHTLIDNSTNKLIETEFKLAEIELETNTIDQLHLNKLTLYQALSLEPVDPLYGGVSRSISLGWERQFNYDLNLNGSLSFKNKWGRTYRLFQDLDIFYLLGGDLNSSLPVLFNPHIDIGLIFRQVNNSKLLINLNRKYGRLEKNEYLNILKIQEGINLFNKYQINLTYESFSNSKKLRENIASLSFRIYY